jgi:hypothetical protein
MACFIIGRFESRYWIRRPAILADISRTSGVAKQNHKMVSLNRPRPVLSTSFPMHNLKIAVLFHATQKPRKPFKAPCWCTTCSYSTPAEGWRHSTDCNFLGVRLVIVPLFWNSKANSRCASINTGKTKTPWSESARELYRSSDSRLSAKWLPTFADRGCHVVSVTDPYGRILGFLDSSRYFSIK